MGFVYKIHLVQDSIYQGLEHLISKEKQSYGWLQNDNLYWMSAKICGDLCSTSDAQALAEFWCLPWTFIDLYYTWYIRAYQNV